MRTHLLIVLILLMSTLVSVPGVGAYSGYVSHAIPIQNWNGHIWAEITLNGHKTKAIVDTGCNSIAIPPSLATQLRVPVVASAKRVALFDRQTNGYTGIVSEAQFGDLVYRNLAVDVIDYPYPIIGLPILAKYACCFDFDRNLLTLAPSPVTQTASAIQIPLIEFWGLYAVQGTLSDAPQTFVVDTGADTTIASLKTVAQIPRTRIMASPEHHLTMCRFAKIQIGNQVLNNPKMAVYDQPDTAGNTAVNTGAIMLGLPYWDHYNVTFDFPAQRMSMTVRKNR